MHIDLSGCHLITPVGAQYLASHCPNMRNLKLNYLYKLSDQHLRICSSFVNLTEIIILNSPDLTDETFRYLCKAVQLRKIKIASNKHLTDASIKLLAKSCSDIRYVSLIDCERISDASCRYLSACKNLTVLNLADCVR